MLKSRIIIHVSTWVIAAVFVFMGFRAYNYLSAIEDVSYGVGFFCMLLIGWAFMAIPMPIGILALDITRSMCEKEIIENPKD